MAPFAPRFTTSHRITAGLTAIERARGFLEAATLSEDWVRRMSQRALLAEAHATTHIEGTELTLAQAERLFAGETIADVSADDPGGHLRAPSARRRAQFDAGARRMAAQRKDDSSGACRRHRPISTGAHSPVRRR